MKIGDKITFAFGNGEKEGTVFKVFPNTVYIKVDFAQHKGKIIKRSIMEVQPKKEMKTKEEKKKEKKKEVRKKEAKHKEEAKKKIKAAKEGRKKEKAAKKPTQ